MLNKDYIIPALNGRLGNQMFMVANAQAKALEHNKQLVIIGKDLAYEGTDYRENVFRKFDFIDKYDDNRNYNPVVPSNNTHTIYVGYYQSESYFNKYSEHIKSLFSPTSEFTERIKKELPFIFEKRVTVINVRKGHDYLALPRYHPTVSVEYLNKAIEKIPQTDVYLVASDNLEWCKENLSHLPNVHYLEGYKSFEQLWILSFCHNFIISNSSFSWWAAYLSRQVNKIVVAPETWFGPDGPNSWNDIYCNGWIVLPTYFNNGLILPK